MSPLQIKHFQLDEKFYILYNNLNFENKIYFCF